MGKTLNPTQISLVRDSGGNKHCTSELISELTMEPEGPTPTSCWRGLDIMARYWGILVVVMLIMLLFSCSCLDSLESRKEVMPVLSEVLKCSHHFLPDSERRTVISLESDRAAKCGTSIRMGARKVTGVSCRILQARP